VGILVIAALAWMRRGSQSPIGPTAVVPAVAARSETRHEPEPVAAVTAPPAVAQPPVVEPPSPALQHPPTSNEANPAARRAPPSARRAVAAAPAVAPKSAAPPPEVAPPRNLSPAEPAARSQPGASSTAEPGYLSFDSMPWSEVYLGAKHLGTTPLIRFSLPPGRHVLTLKNPEVGASTSYVVEITSGKSVSRFVGWEKE
jgi:serine/threonine-protein kinase